MLGCLYIFGTNHPLQCGCAKCPPDHLSAFENELRAIIEKYRIQRIAEEMNAEGLKLHKVDATIAHRLALCMNLHHHNVELSSEERNLLGIGENAFVQAISRISFKDGGGQFRLAFDKNASKVRERCWVGRILAKPEWPTLFICGADHSESIRSLWSQFRLKAVVLHSDYAP